MRLAAIVSGRSPCPLNPRFPHHPFIDFGEFDHARLLCRKPNPGTMLRLRTLDRHLWKRPGVRSRGPTEKEQSMNWDRIEGNWKQLRGKAQQQWGKLTDDDLTYVEGRRVELVGKIQERYGVAKDEAEKQVDNWMRNIG
jgi:uncharacterized protein YjbJ (UPF0337 family)